MAEFPKITLNGNLSAFDDSEDCIKTFFLMPSNHTFDQFSFHKTVRGEMGVGEPG